MNRYIYLVVCLVLVLAGCGPTAPYPESDSSQKFGGSGRIPIDQGIYNVDGVVVGEIGSLTRTEGGRGTLSVIPTPNDSYISGSYWPAQSSGKGFVRLLIEKIAIVGPGEHLATNEINVGQIALLKTTDTKTMALLPGDYVKFKCRMQYEAVAAVMDSEVFEESSYGTWELDYCRLTGPEVRIGGQ